MSGDTDTWISLPVGWKLEDVQAALNVVITALSGLAVFAFIRYCWQRAAKQITSGKHVPLPSLLSLNTLGEVFDIALLLKLRIFRTRHVFVLAQCLVVLLLSATAIFSGPIARYSARRGTVTIPQDTPGSLASRNHNGIGYANVEWNLTYDRLERANFPLDQMLDFLPDNTINWVYNPTQWNSSWSLICQNTNQTDVQLEITGNCTKFPYEIPGLGQIVSYAKWNSWAYSWDGFYSNLTSWKDVLLFLYAQRGSNYNKKQDTYLDLDFMVTAVHLHRFPMAVTTECQFGFGQVEAASYTKIECSLHRRNLSDEQQIYVAFPDMLIPKVVPSAYTQYYQARFTQQSTSDTPISMVTPFELIRFYQVYNVIKDHQYRQPVTRMLDVQVRVVQLSATFLAIVILVSVLTLLFIATYGIFALRHNDVLSSTPQSKLDWMIQSIQAEDHPLAELAYTGHGTVYGRLQSSVTIDEIERTYSASGTMKRRKGFEAATYTNRDNIVGFLKEPPKPVPSGHAKLVRETQLPGSDAISMQGSPMIEHGDKTPILKDIDLGDGRDSPS